MQGFFDGMDEYERRKERSRRQQADQSKKGRDIGPLPAVVDPERKERCKRNLRLYCETYHAEKFTLAWSDDHLEVIARIESTVLDGGLAAYAMARGSGKTTICICATEWAAGYGHRRFIVPIGATKPHAEAMLETIKTDFETNELLVADFPEVSYPITKLEGINNRSGGQILNGVRTRVKWTGKQVVLPTVRDAAGQFCPSSGVVIKAAGLLGAIRGMQYLAPGGEQRRPDLVFPDDPQTDESARRPAQTATRMRIIKGAVLGLAGPGKKIAGLVPCTIIQQGDLASQLLDRQANPEWRGQTSRLLKSMPNDAALALWIKYREVREDSLREHEDIRDATAFYVANREAMDAGAVAGWESRFEPGQISAIQFGMDIWSADERTFWAEYQNAPLEEEEGDIETLKAAELMVRGNGLKRGQVPESAVRVNAFIDVQQDVLIWGAFAWSSDMGGAIIDYGVYPEQAKRYWTLRDLTRTLREETGLPTVEEALRVGLDQLIEKLLGRQFQRFGEEGDGAFSISWLGVDANWQLSSQMVYAAAKRNKLVHPFHGRFVGAASLPMEQWRKEPGTKLGHFWRVVKDRQNGPQVQADINAWKSIVAKRLRVEVGKPGGIELFGDNPRAHELLCDQLSAEYGVKLSGRGRRVDEWKNRPGRDNHYWDILVGAAVGASVQGSVVTGQAVQPEKKRLSLKELQEANRRK
jgi:ADP-ribose pyrophosphatase YjhB (NUDIX family)